MQESKLLEAYLSLDHVKLKQFDRFMQSPYFNESTILLSLHKILYHQVQKKLETPTREEVFCQLYPSQKFDDARIRYLMSRLLELLEEFLFQEGVKHEQNVKQLYLFDYYEAKNCNKTKEQLVNKIRRESDKSKPIRDNDFLERYRLEELLQRASAANIEEYSKYMKEHFSTAISALDAYYFINKLRHLCSLLNAKNVVQMDVHFALQEEILQITDKGYLSENKLIQTYRLIYKTLTETGNTADYWVLRDSLFQEWQIFNINEAREIFAYVQNFGIKQINLGNSEFNEELFRVYDFGLQSGILLQNGLLSEANYKNITVIGLRSGHLDWVKEFIENYRSYLPEENQANAYIFNKSNYHFYKKEYTEVLKLLQDVVFNYIFYAIDYRIILLKTYFELQEREADRNANTNTY